MARLGSASRRPVGSLFGADLSYRSPSLAGFEQGRTTAAVEAAPFWPYHCGIFAGSAASVLIPHDELLAEPLGQPLSYQARDYVSGAAGRVWNDDAHRPRRIGLRARAASGHTAAPPSPRMNSRRRISHASQPLYGQQPTATTGN